MRSALLAAFASQDPTPLREAGSPDDAPLVLCNVGTLTEGIDVVTAACCILAKRVGHAGALLQMVGRVLRAAPGKGFATLIDLCGSVHKHGLPEADREYSLDGKAIRLSGDEKAPRVVACLACGAAFGAWSQGPGGVRSCPVCGERAPLAQQPVVKERELLAMGSATPEDLRRTALHALALQAVQGDYHWRWAVHKYAERFQDKPAREAVQEAFRWARRPDAPCVGREIRCRSCGTDNIVDGVARCVKEAA